MGFFQKIVNYGYKKEISYLIKTLSELTDDELSEILARSLLLRIDLEIEGTVPTVKDNDGVVISELIGLVPLWSAYTQCISMVKGNFTVTVYLKIWYFSVLALIKPDLIVDGVRLWDELSRGLPNINQKLTKLLNEKESPHPHELRMRVFKVLELLPPKDLTNYKY